MENNELGKIRKRGEGEGGLFCSQEDDDERFPLMLFSKEGGVVVLIANANPFVSHFGAIAFVFQLQKQFPVWKTSFSLILV